MSFIFFNTFFLFDNHIVIDLRNLSYEEIKFDCGYRIDILVNRKVIIELKVVENFTIEHIAQGLTYMRFSNCKLGLLLNFYKRSLKDGIKTIDFISKTLRNFVLIHCATL